MKCPECLSGDLETKMETMELCDGKYLIVGCPNCGYSVGIKIVLRKETNAGETMEK